MSHFAEINENGIVLRVIVAEQDFIDSGKAGEPTRWVQTSFNTHEGEHKLGGTPLRKNYAAIGYKYDSVLDAFIPPKIFNSWVLDEQKCVYVPPKEAPVLKDKEVPVWNEEKQDWDIKEKLDADSEPITKSDVVK